MIRALTIATLLLVSPAMVCAGIQSQDSSQAPAQGQPAKTPKPKPRKVWTDENLDEAGGTISVVGEPRSPSKTETVQSHQAKSAAKPSDGAVDAKTLAALRQQLQKLESDLAVVDRQLAQLKGFSKGDSKNAGGLQSDTWQYNSSSVDEQLRQLQQKKSQIQAVIDNLLDTARASGVEPGQLR